MRRTITPRTGLGQPLLCDLARRAAHAPETTMTMKSGDFCAWHEGSDTARGRVVEVHTKGSVQGTAGHSIAASPRAPVARIEIYRAEGNGFLPTGTFKAAVCATLTPAAALRGPETFERVPSAREKARLGSTMLVKTFQGMTVHVDRPKGTKISGVGPDAQPYHKEYQCDYGFFPEVKSHDGEDLDCYLGPSESAAQKVYLVTQCKARKEGEQPVYDETKCLLGCMSAMEAKLLYMAHVHPTMYGGLGSLSLDDFKTQLAAHKGQTTPVRFEGVFSEDEMPPNPMDSDNSPLGASSSHPNPEPFGGQPSGNHDGTPSSAAPVGEPVPSSGPESTPEPAPGSTTEPSPETTPSAKLAAQQAAPGKTAGKTTDICGACGCALHMDTAVCPTCKKTCPQKAAKPAKKTKGKSPTTPETPHVHAHPAAQAGNAPHAGAQRAAPGRSGAAADADGLHVRAANVRAMRPETREIDIIASTEAVDSFGEIVRANWDLKRFLANPVILWAHNRRDDLPPVGRAKNVRVEDGKLLMTIVFSKISAFDEEVFQKYVQGFLNGFSVGFDPRRVVTEWIDGVERVVLDENELHEVSCVPIPSNPEALVASYAKALGVTRQKIAALLHLHEEPTRTKAAVPYYGYAVDTATAWDGAAEVFRWRVVCSKDGSGDAATINWNKYREMFAWYDKAAPEKLDSYKLPHHVVRDGRLFTSKAGVQTAGNVIEGGRGGVKIPDADLPAVKDHLARHYAQFDSKPPWDEGKTKVASATTTTKETDMDLKEMQSALTEKTEEAATHKSALDTERTKSADLDARCKALTADLDAEKTKAASLIEVERAKAAAAEERAASLTTQNALLLARAEAAESKVVDAELAELVKTKMFPAEIPNAKRVFKAAQSAKLLGTDNDPWAAYLDGVKARPDHGLTTQVIKDAGTPAPIDGAHQGANGATNPGALGRTERAASYGGNDLLAAALDDAHPAS